jgi:hypothetical protein
MRYCARSVARESAFRVKERSSRAASIGEKKMNEADLKTAVAIIKTGAEAGVRFGAIEGRVRAAPPGITDKDIEVAFEKRAAGEFRAEADALFAEADEFRRFQEMRPNLEAEIDPLPPDLWGWFGNSSQR